MSKRELLIPTWPEAYATAQKIGAADYGSACGSDSMWVHLRSKPAEGSDEYEHSDAHRVWQDISLYLYVSKDGRCCIELRAHELHSGDVRYLELLLKTLKWALKRLPTDGNFFDISELPFRLASVCTALGIKRTVEYHGINTKNTYADITKALALINAEALRRYNRMQGVAA